METLIATHEEELFQKLQSFCAYRERCSFEVEQKLRRMGAGKTHIEKTIIRLKKDGFLDDRRFTDIYVRSKMFNKNWGKTKTKYYLRQLNIPEKYIADVFGCVDENEYNNNLKDIIKKKYSQISVKDEAIRKNKTANYCIQKGFEAYLVWQLIDEVIKEQKA